MDERDTSHPYYWSGFAVVGDGAAPVIRGPEADPRRRLLNLIRNDTFEPGLSVHFATSGVY